MAVIATAGHVDHGKSSLVLALTGTDPDRLAEEKKRGMTIDLGFAHVVTRKNVLLSFIDVPGHVDFIRNMIAGVSEVSAALLVVDASEGWMPQTTEHCDIVSLLGIEDVVVAITKIDRVSPEQVVSVRNQISQHLSEHGLHAKDVVATSVITGEGIDVLRELLESLVQSHRKSATQAGRFRLFVDRVFTMSGSGTVVTGTLQGEISIDQKLSIARTGQEVRVRSIQTYGQEVDSVVGPVRCALNLSGVAVQDIVRGDALVVADQWHITSQIDALLQVLLSLKHPVGKRGQYMLHVGSSDQEVRLRTIGVDEIVPGSSGYVRLSLSTPLPLLPGDRFVLRETGRSETIGGGEVCDVHPVSSLANAHPDGTLDTYLQERGWMKISDVLRETGVECVPIAGEWVADDRTVAATTKALHEQLSHSTDGIDVVTLRPWEMLLVQAMPEVVVTHGRARLGDQLSEGEQKVANVIRNGGVKGEDAALFSRDIIRRLVQRRLVYEHDGIVFHTAVLEEMRPVLTQLWNDNPDGFSMAQLRDALAITRKHAVPLGTVLDKHGFTKRRGDLRVPGVRWTM